MGYFVQQELGYNEPTTTTTTARIQITPTSLKYLLHVQLGEDFHVYTIYNIRSIPTLKGSSIMLYYPWSSLRYILCLLNIYRDDCGQWVVYNKWKMSSEIPYMYAFNIIHLINTQCGANKEHNGIFISLYFSYSHYCFPA